MAHSVQSTNGVG